MMRLSLFGRSSKKSWRAFKPLPWPVVNFTHLQPVSKHMQMSEKAAKVVPLNHAASVNGATKVFNLGRSVYLTQDYYEDHDVLIAKLPKFGWTVTGNI